MILPRAVYVWAIGIFIGLLAGPVIAGELPTDPLPPLPDNVQAVVEIIPQRSLRSISPQFLGTNLHPGNPRQDLIIESAVRQRTRDMGMKTLRFPNGCLADLYDWRQPNYPVSVEAFIDFCDAVGAEPYYTLNLQGGTEGLDGPIPTDAPLEEVIKYKHTAGNPCGFTNYSFDTLDDALDFLQTYTIQRALDGRTPILHYELGNENWGQAKTDWPPLVYGKTCEVYTAAMRQAFADAQAQHPELAGLELYFVMVGFPSMGNNMDPWQAVDRQINVDWTAEVNRLAGLGLIDAVQEHFYPYISNDGSGMLWTIHNLSNILHLRNNVPNPRLDGYADDELDYEVPIEWTEWNVKCWGNYPRTDLPLQNQDFESGLTHWTAEASPAGSGTATIDASAARRGDNGVLLSTGPEAEYVEIRQQFSVADRASQAHLYGIGTWIRSATPTDVHVMIKQANAGEHEGAVIGAWVGRQTNMWDRIIVNGTPHADTTELEVVVRLNVANRTAFVDSFATYHWPTSSNNMPAAAARLEQQLFIADSLRVLMQWDTPRTHLHHLIGGYPCPVLDNHGKLRDNAEAFHLLHERIGQQLVDTATSVPTFDYDTAGDSYSTDFNAATPDLVNAPALSATTTRTDDTLHVFLVNRTTDRPIETTFNLRNAAIGSSASVRTLSGTDLDVTGANLSESQITVNRPLTHTVPPYSAQILTLDMTQITDAPIVLAPTSFDREGFVAEGLAGDTFSVASGGPDPMNYSIEVIEGGDWLSVSPSSGTSTGAADQIQISYTLDGMTPGTYTGTIKVSSPDAYNSPQSVTVELTIKTLQADFDSDGDVDHVDFSHLQSCLSGAGIPKNQSRCQDARMDLDTDVDSTDIAHFLACYSGPNHPPQSDCSS